MGALVSDPAARPLRRASVTALARAADHPRGHHELSDEASGTETQHRGHGRCHPHPAGWLAIKIPDVVMLRAEKVIVQLPLSRKTNDGLESICDL